MIRLLSFDGTLCNVLFVAWYDVSECSTSSFRVFVFAMLYLALSLVGASRHEDVVESKGGGM